MFAAAYSHRGWTMTGKAEEESVHHALIEKSNRDHEHDLVQRIYPRLCPADGHAPRAKLGIYSQVYLQGRKAPRTTLESSRYMYRLKTVNQERRRRKEASTTTASVKCARKRQKPATATTRSRMRTCKVQDKKKRLSCPFFLGGGGSISIYILTLY